MKIPNFKCKIIVNCEINPSEEFDKVSKALNNIFPSLEILEDKNSINLISEKLDSLENIFEYIHSTNSQKTFLRNLECTRENLGNLMLELRKQNGPGAIAELIESDINSSPSNVILIDGVRSNDEINILRKFGNVKLLAIHASTDTRFEFLKQRGRSDDPQTKEHFDERDNRELGVGISNSIALSDFAISNIGLTKDELIQKAYSIIESWI